jgi:hypothetical protein
MIAQTESREETDIEVIIRESFQACREPNDYVAATRRLILKEQTKNAVLEMLLHQVGETAAPTNAGHR